ncbi:MAG: polysaccharide pyruvyl transferase family protein [Erythrobacter sp.]|uniref:polysaccharide pyruvyl transferase family protein n=1 Tax=Erythrobacter sp. TaxID=1042 RepID=UPI0032987A93
MTDSFPENQPRKTIGFVGTFDVANYGDCLFPVVYMHLLSQSIAGLEFSFYSPLARSAEIMDYGPVKALPATVPQIAFDEDALILCGGETLWFGHSSGTFNFHKSTLSSYLRLWLTPCVAASRAQVDFYVHSVGMPRADLDAPAEIAEVLGAATMVSVRDEVTATRLGNRFPVEVDPVFSLSNMKSQEEWQTEARQWLPVDYNFGKYLVAQVSMPYLNNGLQEWCEQVALTAKNHDLPILLVPICHFMDDRYNLKEARSILIELGIAENRVCLPPLASKDVIATAALLGMSAGVITSSLHACVTAVSFGVPFAGFVGNGKADGKHRQTLLAAGVNYGMAMEIGDLAQIFADSSNQDCAIQQSLAIERSMKGLMPLVEGLRHDRRASSPLQQTTIDAMLFHDKRPTRHLRLEFKRTILRWANKSHFLAGLLVARRRARMRRKTA